MENRVVLQTIAEDELIMMSFPLDMRIDEIFEKIIRFLLAVGFQLDSINNAIDAISEENAIFYNKKENEE